MVTKYSGYIHTPATRATGYVEDPNGSVVLASDYAALEAELARIQSGPHFVQYVDRLNEIYRRRREGGDDAERFLAIDELCRKLANESDEFMAQRDEARAELARAREYHSDFKRLADEIANGTSPRVKQGEGKPYTIPSVAEYEVLMEGYLQQRKELARVKAESLRVVVDGPQREAFRCDKVLHDGRYCFVGPRILDDYFPLQISDSITGKYVDKVTHQTLLQPVRLERWEDEG